MYLQWQNQKHLCHRPQNEISVRVGSHPFPVRWHGLSNNLNLSDIGVELEKKFDVSEEKAAQSVIYLVEELVSEKLVSVKGE